MVKWRVAADMSMPKEPSVRVLPVLIVTSPPGLMICKPSQLRLDPSDVYWPS